MVNWRDTVRCTGCDTVRHYILYCTANAVVFVLVSLVFQRLGIPSVRQSTVRGARYTSWPGSTRTRTRRWQGRPGSATASGSTRWITSAGAAFTGNGIKSYIRIQNKYLKHEKNITILNIVENEFTYSQSHFLFQKSSQKPWKYIVLLHIYRFFASFFCFYLFFPSYIFSWKASQIIPSPLPDGRGINMEFFTPLLIC